MTPGTLDNVRDAISLGIFDSNITMELYQLLTTVLNSETARLERLWLREKYYALFHYPTRSPINLRFSLMIKETYA